MGKNRILFSSKIKKQKQNTVCFLELKIKKEQLFWLKNSLYINYKIKNQKKLKPVKKELKKNQYKDLIKYHILKMQQNIKQKIKIFLL